MSSLPLRRTTTCYVERPKFASCRGVESSVSQRRWNYSVFWIANSSSHLEVERIPLKRTPSRVVILACWELSSILFQCHHGSFTKIYIHGFIRGWRTGDGREVRHRFTTLSRTSSGNGREKQLSKIASPSMSIANKAIRNLLPQFWTHQRWKLITELTVNITQIFQRMALSNTVSHARLNANKRFRRQTYHHFSHYLALFGHTIAWNSQVSLDN